MTHRDNEIVTLGNVLENTNNFPSKEQSPLVSNRSRKALKLTADASSLATSLMLDAHIDSSMLRPLDSTEDPQYKNSLFRKDPYSDIMMA